MKPTIICLTPVKNEAWILDRFLKAASLWADFIIIADQMSTDGSREIAKKYSKVILIENQSETFNEPERQRLLINEARKIEGPRLLIALDADEIFSPEILTSAEWNTVLNSKPGTLIKFQWANFRPDMKTMWMGEYFPWGYMDDGIEYTNSAKIHSGRIPVPLEHDVIFINQIKVIHFQYTEWEKMKSKHRFYQCYETITFPHKSPLQLFRTYHHMYEIKETQIIPIPDKWIEQYNEKAVDITSVFIEPTNWFDIEVIKMIERYGANKFKKIRIWDKDWVELAKTLNLDNIEFFKDPRKKFDRKIQKWLFETQKRQSKRHIKLMQNIIIQIFKY